jgi:hypothetical protein
MARSTSPPYRRPIAALSPPYRFVLFIALSLPYRCPIAALSLPYRCPIAALSLPYRRPIAALSLPYRRPIAALSLPYRRPIASTAPPLCCCRCAAILLQLQRGLQCGHFNRNGCIPLLETLNRVEACRRCPCMHGAWQVRGQGR